MSGTPVASPTVHVNHWSESQVADWLSTIGLAKFAKDFKGNGITGDVLILLDDDALRDIGVATVGQRLSLLSAIYRLKLQFAIPIQEGDWIPKSSEVHDGYPATATSPHLVSLLRQRDDRIRTLESQIFRLADYLSRFQQDFASVCKHVGVKTLTSEMAISVVSGSTRPGETGGHSHTSSESSTHSLSAFGSQPDLATSASSHAIDSPTARNSSGIVSPTRSGFATSLGHRPGAATYTQGSYGQQHFDEGQASGNASVGPLLGFKPAGHAGMYHRSNDALGSATGPSAAVPNTPTTVAAGMHASTSLPSLSSASVELSPTHSTPSATPTTATPAHGHGSSASAIQSPTRRQAQPSPSGNLSRSASNNALAQARNISPVQQAGSSSATATAAATGAIHSTPATDASSKLDRVNPTAPASSSSSSKTNTDSGPSVSSNGHPSASTSSDINPYKSFRVTLDDPCHKVLPAALKKYKIVDDWRLYALFICYGSTERCLSYDEKPLLLFQKLKENKQSPVFMLRHIRDVKSPIAIANAKAESKKSQTTTSSTVKASAGGRSDKRRVIDGAPPSGANIAHLAAPVETGPAAELPASTKASRTYAVAIYPYLSERGDEFDVGVGDIFIVRNKAKGWWVVQRDSKGTGAGDVVYSVPSSETDDANPNAAYQAEISSGWVPAGCLLETSRPLSQIVEPGTLATAATQDQSSSFANSGPSTPTVATLAAATTTTPGGGPSGGTVSASATASIPPTYITSTSTLGVMLMDYSADDGLEFNKGDRLRVFKRYNHWSYCVQEGDPHARGWVPSWYIGKISTANGGGSGAAGPSSAGNTPKDAKDPSPATGGGTTISPTTLISAPSAAAPSKTAGSGGASPGAETKPSGKGAGSGLGGPSPSRTASGDGGVAAGAGPGTTDIGDDG
ncbi:uncharacterized protein PFL1_05327 [Pseudozyma flocculosa PF-1]|uniref:Related to MAP kinase pathway-interacting protein n=2 Tax=Pseudozyma flocculosa TaxID=84751 RepID=A0A5C3FCX4_9BASI|nr:uncharacterized protein PFL1_05327 [Pseudozyma flocculosa PF-1]EPQ27043.1 hypothetical protein PFL1_05327 [Pseudozyma flocculosa PF-1]SPO42120.1 related to MAP kinase pathway-interacting protein [Pseudozyma flocculosa]